tara:strand:+ start:1432 stop:1686 length:255 start_codon:yes stop_codon:yes gene_type:complete
MSTIRIDIADDADLSIFSVDLDEDDRAPFSYDLMVSGLSDSTDVEVQLPGRGIPGAVILHGTSASIGALGELRALPWVEDATAS